MDGFGKELILDLSNCDPTTFTRKSIRKFFKELCDLIKMEREDLRWWDYYGVPEEDLPTEEHLRGTTAVQFIKTSNIVVHTLDLTGHVYINVFSCKDFDEDVAAEFSEKWFGGEILSRHILDRQKQDKVEIVQQKGHNFLWINGYLYMWDIPVERKTQKGIAEEAYGDVLVAGYGLGVCHKYLVQSPKVESITTIEKFPDVIKECERVYGLIHGDVEIGDFYSFNGNRKFDCVIGDIWDDILPEHLEEYKRFRAKALTLLKSGGKLLAWGKDYYENLLLEESK